MTLLYIENDNGKLAVEVEGPEDGPLVILSPAMGDTRASYAPLAQQLVAAGYRVAWSDLRGHGDSSVGFGSYGDEATACDLLVIVDTLTEGDGRPIVLAGASMSGAAATIAAGQRPEQVAGLLLFGAFLRNGSFGTMMRHLLAVAFIRPWGPPLWRSYAATLWPGLGHARAVERAASTTALLTRPGRWPAFYATTRTDHSVVAPWLIKARKVPALVVIGDADPDWSSPVDEAGWVASNFGTAEVLVAPGCGHAPMLESPGPVGSAVLRFLSTIREGNTFIQTR